MHFLDRTASALAPFGIGLCEHFVMCQVGYRTGCGPDAVAKHSREESAGDRRGEFTLAEHQAAMRACLGKGLLTVLSAAEAEAEHDRRSASGLPELIDHGAQPGALDFTQTGFEAHRAIILAVFGEAHVLQSDSGWNHHQDRHRFEVYAPTLDLCRGLVAGITADVESYCGEPAVVTSVSPPAAIGPWRPSRFVVRPAGYRADVAYLPGENGPRP